MASPLDLLKTSFNLFKKHFVYLLVFWLIDFGLTLAAFIPLIIIAVTTGMFAAISHAIPHLNTLLPTLIYIPVLILLLLWFSTSLTVQLNAVGQDQRSPFRQLFSVGWQKTWPMLVLSLSAGFLTTLGFVLFIVPGLIFSVWFSFAGPVIINEHLGAFASMGRSKSLIKGRFWTAVKYLILPFLVSLAYSLLTSVALGPVPLAKSLASLLYIPLQLILGVYSFQVYFAFRDHPVSGSQQLSANS